MATNATTMRGYAVPIIVFLVMALLQLTHAQMAPAPAPSNYGATVDQGIAYILLLVALAVTYLLH